MQYPAERLLSESDKHPLLVYRSTEDQQQCFKRTNSDSYAYVCKGCQDAYKAGNPVQIRSPASFSSLRGIRLYIQLHRRSRTSDSSVSFYVDVYQIVFREVGADVKKNGTKRKQRCFNWLQRKNKKILSYIVVLQ
jgi:hypothetical protein